MASDPHHRLRHPAPPRVHRAGDGRGHAAHRLLADPQLEPRLLHRGLRRPTDAWPPRPSTCPSTWAPCRGRCNRWPTSSRAASRPATLPPQRSVSRRQSPARPHRAAARLRGRAAWSSGRSTGRTRATSAARPTGPTIRAPPRSGRKASASPPLKLYDAGVLRDDVLQMVATNVRHPRDFLGDLRAMMGSARIGERRLLKLVDDYGLETVLEAVGEILDGAERQSRASASAAGRTGSSGARRSSTTTATASTTSTSAPPSPRRATRSPWISPTRTRR